MPQNNGKVAKEPSLLEKIVDKIDRAVYKCVHPLEMPKAMTYAMFYSGLAVVAIYSFLTATARINYTQLIDQISNPPPIHLTVTVPKEQAEPHVMLPKGVEEISATLYNNMFTTGGAFSTEEPAPIVLWEDPMESTYAQIEKRYDIVIPNETRISIQAAAEKYGVDEELIIRLIERESMFLPDLVSNRGAAGYMQLMPETARDLGMNVPPMRAEKVMLNVEGNILWAYIRIAHPEDERLLPDKNIEKGVEYLAELLDMFNGDEKLALAAYNCGPNKVKRIYEKKSGGFRRYEERKYSLPGQTRLYVYNILKNMNRPMELFVYLGDIKGGWHKYECIADKGDNPWTIVKRFNQEMGDDYHPVGVKNIKTKVKDIHPGKPVYIYAKKS